MIFYTSDLHFGHTNIMHHCNRPFTTVEDMDRVLIENWNSVVKDKDDVYILGDLSYRGNKEDVLKNVKMLKGNKILIVGNHDGYLLKDAEFRSLFVDIKDTADISDNSRRVVLFHYPILEWNGFYRGSYHVYGHIHNGSPQVAEIMRTLPRAFNAGVDLNDFMPQTLDGLIKRKEMGKY